MEQKNNNEPPINDPLLCKLVILFTLEKMEFPLKEDTIYDIIYYRNNWMNYMDCKEYLYKLVESNLVYKTISKDGEERFNITYDGRNCLHHFGNKIDSALREQITEYTKVNRLHFKRSQEYVSTFFKSEDGSYIVVLKIRPDTTQEEAMFEIKIKAPSRLAAIEACNKWQENAHMAYEAIYDMFIEET